ncbi:alpha/beta fold hydrolase [Leucobacter chromiireducens]|uniref:alpha/beta fold hydrolase n=1 Tax=Leucobacter chromiireducens TaxID=283877 RepID=UPI003D663634
MSGSDRRTRLGDIEIAVSDTPGPAGLTFVLVHGIGMGRATFAGVGAELAARGRVLALDLPGFGDSPEPGSETTIEETGELLARFIRAETSGPVILVGHSMGTQVVAEVALHHPELVAGLALIAPHREPARANGAAAGGAHAAGSGRGEPEGDPHRALGVSAHESTLVHCEAACDAAAPARARLPAAHHAGARAARRD